MRSFTVLFHVLLLVLCVYAHKFEISESSSSGNNNLYSNWTRFKTIGSGKCVCPNNYEPVCDTVSQTTFTNLCQATCHRSYAVAKGACKQQRKCVCRAITINRVCDSESGITYDSRCKARCAGRMNTVKGVCALRVPSEIRAPPVLQSVTTTTSSNYHTTVVDAQQQQQEHEMEVEHQREQLDGIQEEELEDEQEDENEQELENEQEFENEEEQAATVVLDNRTPATTTSVLATAPTIALANPIPATTSAANTAKTANTANTPLPPRTCECGKQFKPVCDKSSSTTYSNACVARCAGVTLFSNGRCAPSTLRGGE